jgi:transmembrane sensor
MTHHEEAAHWFAVRRRGVMTLEERSAFDAWTRQRENRTALAAMDDLWQSLEGAQAPDRHAPRIRSRMMFAAICVFSLGLGIMSSAAREPFWTSLDWTNR